MTMNRMTLTTLITAIPLIVLASGCAETASKNNANSNTVATVNSNTRATRANRGITREEFNKDRARYEIEAKELGRRVGAGAEDLWLWTKTRAALAYAEDLRDVTINVDVENNTVTLTGSVPTVEQKATAGEIAQSIEGVSSVKNELGVTASGNNNGNASANRNTKSMN